MRNERITYRVIPGVLPQWARSTSVSVLECGRIRTSVRSCTYCKDTAAARCAWLKNKVKQ